MTANVQVAISVFSPAQERLPQDSPVRVTGASHVISGQCLGPRERLEIREKPELTFGELERILSSLSAQASPFWNGLCDKSYSLWRSSGPETGRSTVRDLVEQLGRHDQHLTG
jgi:hypothetical protein